MTLVEAAGLALAIIGVAFAFETPRRLFVRLVGRGAARETATSLPAAPPPLSPITVKEISDAINAAPPFQREEVSRSYAGIRVEWVGYLREVDKDPRDKSQVRVNLAVDRSERIGYSFWFSLSPERLPDIRTLPRNSAIRVAGTILSTSGQGLCADLQVNEIEVIDRGRADA